MADIYVWPAVGASVPCPNEDSPALSTSGATVTRTAYIDRLLASGLLLTYDPLASDGGSSTAIDVADTYLNVKSYGAIGDGTTDDTAAIQRALTAGPSGCTFLFPNGTYLVTSTLTRTSSCTITGPGTIKKGSFDGEVLKIYGLVGTYLSHVTVDGLTFDGNDSGIDYNATYPNVELSTYYVKRVSITRCKFTNTRWRSLSVSTCTTVDIADCRFEDGAPSSGSADSTTAYHCGVFYSTNVSIDRCTFKADITYDAGDRTQAGVVSAAPIAVVGTNNEYVSISFCKSYDAGNFELYEANRNVVIHGNQFDYCHLPAIKLQNGQRSVVTGNTITNSRHWWGAAIQVGCYSRLTTYGCLRPNQGQATIANNHIAGCKSEYGPIFVSGTSYATGDLDTRILADVAAGRTTNKVTLTGPNYTYTDFDGTVYSTIDQTYLLARNVEISGNTIDEFATTGVYAYLCDSVTLNGGSMSRCGTLDTAASTTKACVSVADCMDVTVDGVTCKMLSGTVPTVSSVTSSINGVVAINSLTATRRVGRLKVQNSQFALAKTANCVYFDDCASVQITNNDLHPLSFSSTSGAFIRAVGQNSMGVISGNRYEVTDTSTVPTDSTEYSQLQAGFMSLDFRDDRRTVDRSRRVAASTADFTTPTQSMSGYYSIGSQVSVAATVNSSYYLCTTAGHLAPSYSGATTYSKGNKVVSGGEYFASLQNSNLNHTPTAGVGDSYWIYLGATAAVFSTVALPRVLTGTASHNPSNLNDGVGETTTVTVTGAALGDYADAAFNLDLQGITVTAWVSAADTVSVRFQNETGGAIDLGAGTLTAKVVKP